MKPRRAWGPGTSRPPIASSDGASAIEEPPPAKAGRIEPGGRIHCTIVGHGDVTRCVAAAQLGSALVPAWQNAEAEQLGVRLKWLTPIS